MSILKDSDFTSKASYKKLRFESDLYKHLRLFFVHDIRDPRLHNFHITYVEMSNDLKNAKVFFMTHDDQIQIHKILKRCIGRLRGMLAKKLEFRVVPRLLFLYDKNENQNIKIEALFQQIELEKQS